MTLRIEIYVPKGLLLVQEEPIDFGLILDEQRYKRTDGEYIYFEVPKDEEPILVHCTYTTQGNTGYTCTELMPGEIVKYPNVLGQDFMCTR